MESACDVTCHQTPRPMPIAEVLQRGIGASTYLYIRTHATASDSSNAIRCRLHEIVITWVDAQPLAYEQIFEQHRGKSRTHQRRR